MNTKPVRSAALQVAISFVMFSFFILLFSCATISSNEEFYSADRYIWNNISVANNGDMVIKEENMQLHIYYRPDIYFGKIYIHNETLPPISTIRQNVICSVHSTLLEEDVVTIDGRQALYVKRISKDDGILHVHYFVPSEKISFSYAGLEKNYKYFKPIIASIHFAEK